MEVSTASFGNGGAMLYTITNDQGCQLQATNFGARIVKLVVKNKRDMLQNVVLGFESREDYLTQDTYIGATIGRVAGRLANGVYTDATGKTYHFDQNEGEKTLHGGANSFEEKMWQTNIVQKEEAISLCFTYNSPNGENGFPGNVTASVTYTFTNKNKWKIEYAAKTDQTTLYNPTNHVYFNLGETMEQTVEESLLYINSSEFLPLDSDNLPTGEKRNVNQTAFDFTNLAGTPVKQGFQTEYEQNVNVNGYDHPFVLHDPSLKSKQVTLRDKQSGIQLNMYTDAPAVVVFTLNIGNKTLSMGEEIVTEHGGITFETQMLPDAINHEGFGDILLSPQDEFRSTTIFTFETI